MPLSSNTELAKLISTAMARQEGWYKPTSEQHKRNNPGNMMDLAYYIETKKQTGTGLFRLRVYPSMDDGWNDLAKLVQSKLLGLKLSLLEFVGGKPNVYAGFAPLGHGANDPKVYSANVAGWLSLTPTEPASVDWLMKVRVSAELPVFGSRLGPAKPKVS